MTENQKLREALRRIKHESASLADAQVIALEALSLPTQAEPVEGGEVVGDEPEIPLLRALDHLANGKFVSLDEAVAAANAALIFYRGRIALKARTTPPASQEQADSVPMPTSAAQAELMQKLGLDWLQQHAPERLQPAAQEAVAIERVYQTIIPPIKHQPEQHMTENQKLREALQAIANIDDTTNHSVDASAALDHIGEIARQALALPTAEQVDDINVAESFTSVTKTAAPVCERERFEAWWRTVQMRTFPKEYDIKRLQDWGSAYKPKSLEAWQARAALSAGDAGWQPIETAPKDGSDCWLLVDGDVRRGFWVEIEFEERRDMDGRYIDQTDADAYWMDHDSGDSLEPTMFYPITKPLPPSLVDIDAAMRKDNT